MRFTLIRDLALTVGAAAVVGLVAEEVRPGILGRPRPVPAATTAPPYPPVPSPTQAAGREPVSQGRYGGLYTVADPAGSGQGPAYVRPAIRAEWLASRAAVQRLDVPVFGIQASAETGDETSGETGGEVSYPLPGDRSWARAVVDGWGFFSGRKVVYHQVLHGPEADPEPELAASDPVPDDLVHDDGGLATQAATEIWTGADGAEQ